MWCGNRSFISFGSLFLALFAFNANAFAENLSDYVLFSKGEVMIGGSSKATGLVGSGTKTTLAGAAKVFGNVQSGGDIKLNNGSKITGSATYAGKINIPVSASVGSKIKATPSFPSLPTPAQFVAGGTDYQAGKNGTQLTLAPGTYGALKFGGGAELKLSAGDYYFTSMNAGNGFKIIVNLNGGKIRIFVSDKAHFGSVDLILPAGSKPSDAYMEVQGSSDIFAFASGGGSEWVGTIYTPYAGIHFGGGSCCSSLKGRFIALTQVDIEHGVTITPPPPACEEGQTENPDGTCTTTCPPGQIRNEQGQCITTDCPEGQVRNDAGQCVIVDCPPGQVRNVQGQCVVTDCPVGQVRQADGTCTTSECPAGTVRLPDGQCGESTCPDGTPRKPDGSCGEIVLCPNGQPAGPNGICSTTECEGGVSKDICGVCAGNGSTCNSCEILEVLQKEVVLDNTTHEQLNLIDKATRALEKASKGKEKSHAKSIRLAANKHYMEAWALTYTLPSAIVQNCTAEESVCASVSISGTKTSLLDKSQALQNLLVKTTNYMKKYRKISAKTIASYRSHGTQLLRQNVKLLSEIPESTQVCK